MSDITAAVAGGVPFILTYHAGTMRKNNWRSDMIIWLYEHFVLPLTSSRAEKIICSSEFVRKSVFPGFLDKAIVVTPGVDLNLFKPHNDVQKNEHEIIFVCGLAAMHRMKGLYVLAEAVHLLEDKYPKLTVKVIGEKGSIDSKHINFVGPKRGVELVKEIQSGKALVLCSLAPAESFGMVLIEAMACKMPVIGAATGGIPEVIDDGTDGFIVPPGDASALAKAIENILINRDLAAQMGEEGYRKVQSGFGWEYKVNQTLRVITEAL